MVSGRKPSRAAGEPSGEIYVTIFQEDGRYAGSEAHSVLEIEICFETMEHQSMSIDFL